MMHEWLQACTVRGSDEQQNEQGGGVVRKKALKSFNLCQTVKISETASFLLVITD